MKSNQMDFVIFDVETTGLSCAGGDRIIEVAAVKIRDGEIIDRFESLVNPERYVPMMATMVHGIRDSDLVDAPKAADVMPQLMAFIGKDCLVGHNLRFDVRFLNHELNLLSLDEQSDDLTLDTIKMAKGLFPGLPSYALASVVTHLGVNPRTAHRAMADVLMTGDVFLTLLECARQRHITSLSHLLTLFSLNKVVKQHCRLKLKMISEALSLGSHIDFLYSSKVQGATQRQVTPKTIIGKGKNAALSGYCHLHQKEDMFAIDNMIQVQGAK